jgi:hypothetical protein
MDMHLAASLAAWPVVAGLLVRVLLDLRAAREASKSDAVDIRADVARIAKAVDSAVAAGVERIDSSRRLAEREALDARARAVRESVALAERMGRLGKLKGGDKLAVALDWARSRCGEVGVECDDATLRKLIELELSAPR